MPVGEYYAGHGTEVMKKMKSRYGKEGGKRVFYARANKLGLNRPGKKGKRGKTQGKRGKK